MKIAIVGNALLLEDHSKKIDACDLVIRFNHPRGMGGYYGRKLTHLSLINSGGQVEEWLRKRSLENERWFKQVDNIILPVAPDIANHYHPRSISTEQGAKSHLTTEFQSYLHDLGKEVTIVPSNIYMDCCSSVNIDPEREFLSSGMCVAAYLKKRYLGASISVFGFSWQGWSGHAWGKERQWFERQNFANLPVRQRAA